MVKVSTGVVGIKPPPIPSKWDIIPIHTSDRGTFKYCRRKWSYSSPTTRNLVPRSNIYGIIEHFWFGTGIHHALERFYNPLLKEDPTAAWIDWYELQWNGGLIDKSMLYEYADRNPEPHATIPDVFVVDGLKDVLPDPDPDEFAAYKTLGTGMMNFYKQYAPNHDNFAVIMVEHDFSVPIINPTTGYTMQALDTRVMPDGWEHSPGPPLYHIRTTDNTGVLKAVHARGRMDLIVQDLDNGQYGIMDHKTAKSIGDDYFSHLEIDDQITTYAWAAEQEAITYDLEYKNIDFVIYQGLRKAFPSPPTELANGMPSVAKATESTTALLFEQYIKEHNLKVVFESSAKLQAYYAWLLEQGDKMFIQRDTVKRNKFQKAQLGSRIFYEATDMLNVMDKPEFLYPSPQKDWGCTKCTFRAPCVAQEQGYDYEAMLADGYVSNYDR